MQFIKGILQIFISFWLIFGVLNVGIFNAYYHHKTENLFLEDYPYHITLISFIGGPFYTPTLIKNIPEIR
jgi:hypothetical protein